MREEIVVGNACGGKPGSRGGKVILLSHMDGHHHSLSLSTHQHGKLNNREADHQTPDALNYRVEPHPGGPLKCLMCPSTE